MSFANRAACLACVLTLAACDAAPVTAPLPDMTAGASDALRAYLTLPANTPAAGQQVTVRLNARRPRGAEAFGSFTVRIAYDTAGLRFIGSESSRDGMVLAQSANGVMTVAGASSTGFSDEEVAGVSLLVVDPAALEHLSLEIVELTTTSFREQRAQAVVDQRATRRPVVRLP